MGKLLTFFLVLLAAAGAVYVGAGYLAGPTITVVSPGRFVVANCD